MLDLTKKIYRKLEDGDYQVTVRDWEMKATTPKALSGDLPIDYIALSCVLPELDNRPVTINLFEKGLNIFGSNLINHFELEEQPILDLLNWVKNKTIPGYHETVVNEDATYYNWYLAKEREDI